MNTIPQRPTRTEWTLLALVLILAAVLRMASPGMTEFKLDEARLSLLALDMAEGYSFPLVGIGSSVGIPNMPVNVWLFALPYVFTSNPVGATLFVGALNVLAVALTWWLSRRYFGPWAGLIAALLYAVSPWGVIYSRKIWAQNLLPLFVLLTVGAGLRAFQEEDVPHRGRWLALHIVLLVITVQIHYAALVLLPLTAWMLWLGRRNLSRRLWIGLGVVAATGVMAVGLLLVSLSAGGVNLAVFGGDGLSLTSEALYHFMLVVTGNEIHSLAGAEAAPDYLATSLDVVLAQTVFGWLLVLAAAGMVIAAWRGQGMARSVRLVLLAWLALPVAVFSVTWTPTFPHYLIPLMPAAYIVFAAGTVGAWRLLYGQARDVSRARGAGMLIAGLLLVFAALQAWSTVTLFEFLDTHNTPGGFGTPLHYLLDVRAAALESGTQNALIVGLSDDTISGQDVAVWELLLYDLPSVRPVDGRDTAVLLPSDADTLILNTAAFLEADAALPGLTCPAEAAVFPLREGEGEYRLCTAGDVQPPDLVYPAEPLATFSNGLTLRGAWLAETPDPRVWLAWEAPGPLPADVNVFNHLLDADGARIGQQDGPLWSAYHWRVGEIVLFEFSLPVDAALDAAETLRVGVYRFVDGEPQNLDVLDIAGNPAGQWVDIPLSALGLE